MSLDRVINDTLNKKVALQAAGKGADFVVGLNFEYWKELLKEATTKTDRQSLEFLKTGLIGGLPVVVCNRNSIKPRPYKLGKYTEVFK